MKDAVKKILCIFAVCLFLFCLGFGSGYFFDRVRNTCDQAGTAADVRSYDTAAERVERTVGAVADAAGNVREAAGAVRISIDEVGDIAKIAGDIGDGAYRTLDGTGRIADGIQLIMGILDAAEKRDAQVETAGSYRMD